MESSRPLSPPEGESPGRQARGHDELQLKLEAARTAAAERAVAEERQRIARELHDVVAHSVSVMTVQAGAVRRLLHPDQDRERLALETIEATGREALTEMRRLVGMLRDDSVRPDFAPQPSMRCGTTCRRSESAIPLTRTSRWARCAASLSARTSAARSGS